MVSRFLPIKAGDSILNYYALPLVSLSRRYFGTNFITAKINRSCKTVFIELAKDLYDDMKYPNKVYIHNKFYLFYDIPQQYHADMLKIVEGAYSQLSVKAKQLIREKSGLMYNHKEKGQTYTSKLLFALDKAQPLVDYYFEALKSGVEESDEKLYEALANSELAEKITEDDLL